jgi:hyperosmotically inducible protein
MVRALFRLVLILVVLVGAFMFFTGYWAGRVPTRSDAIVGTSGRSEPIDTDAARRRGAQAGEAVADGANRVGAVAAEAAERSGELLSDAGITAKIKSKLALDESVRALDIDVDTVDGAVTLSGRVDSANARDRAVQLAKETAGVRSVADRLQVR